MIQALARWRSVESLAVYARLSPSDYAAWVAKALVQTTDSTSTRHLPPLIDHFSIVAFLPILRAHLRARREGDPTL